LTDGSINETPLENFQVMYYSSSGEKFTAMSKGNDFSFSPEKSFFCWDGCNIFPRFTLYKEEIRKDDTVISVEELDIGNGIKENIIKSINNGIDTNFFSYK